MAAKCLTGELVEAVRVLRAGGGAFRPLPAAGAGSKTADMDAALAGSAGERSKAICLFILVGSSIKNGTHGFIRLAWRCNACGGGQSFLATLSVDTPLQTMGRLRQTHKSADFQRQERWVQDTCKLNV